MITVIPRRGLFALLPLTKRSFVLTLVLLPSILMWLYHIVPAIRSGIFQPTGHSPVDSVLGSPLKDDENESELIDLASYPYNARSNLSVNLVVATVRKEDISWTSRLRIPNLNIIRYVSDDVEAPYHPPVAKGREALMYHTYLYDFYDDLPDVSIFVHAHENPWHTDPELWSSMLFALSNLDLDAVVDRGYANLRVDWHDACPDWINTTKTVEESVKQEEPWMAAAFRANFGDDDVVPESIGGPCCSQFAVTREAVHRRDRDTYARTKRWLVETDWSDYIVGRTWEHMWSFLFKYEATDCPVEWKTFCLMYGVCFEGAPAVAEFRAMWQERKDLAGRRGFWLELWDPQRAVRERERIKALDAELNRRLRVAMEKGRAEKASSRTQAALGDLYVDDTPILV
jgi:hypothetical protein